MDKIIAEAYLNDKTVGILGGYHKVDKGFLVTVTTDEVKEVTVPFTNLGFHRPEEAEEVFLKLYRLTADQARERGYKKGVPEPTHDNMPLDEATDAGYEMCYKSGKLAMAT